MSVERGPTEFIERVCQAEALPYHSKKLQALRTESLDPLEIAAQECRVTHQVQRKRLTPAKTNGARESKALVEQRSRPLVVTQVAKREGNSRQRMGRGLRVAALTSQSQTLLEQLTCTLQLSAAVSEPASP